MRGPSKTDASPYASATTNAARNSKHRRRKGYSLLSQSLVIPPPTSHKIVGFYSPQPILRDVRDHGVEVACHRCDTHSDWDCTLEVDTPGQAPALRLGLRLVKGLSEASAAALASARDVRAFTDTTDLVHRSRLARRDLERLAGANSLSSLAGHRVETERALLAQAPQTKPRRSCAPRVKDKTFWRTIEAPGCRCAVIRWPYCGIV